MRKLLQKIVLTVLICLCVCAGVLKTRDISANAEGTYLPITQCELTVTAFEEKTRNYSITLTYAKGELPQFNKEFINYLLKINFYDSQDIVTANKLSVTQFIPESPSQIKLVISKEDKNGEIGYSSLKTGIIHLSAGTKVTYVAEDEGCVGIEFPEGLTLYASNGTLPWTTENGEEPEVYLGVARNDVSFFYSETERSLVAVMNVGHEPKTDCTFETAITLVVDGEEVKEKIKAVQFASENHVRCTLPKISDNAMTITIQSGTLTHAKNKITYTLLEPLTYYKYADGTWETERHVLVRENVNGVLTETKMSATETYNFSLPEMETTSVFIGWSFNKKLYKVGESVNLADYKALILDVDAVYVSYALKKGASIRYDEMGEGSGIRFASNLSKVGYDVYKPFLKRIGIIIMPEDLIGEKEFVWKNYNGENQAKNFMVEASQLDFGTGNTYTLSASIVKVLSKNYNRVFAARAYFVVDYNGNETYVWDKDIEKRTIYYTASKAIEADRETNALSDTKRAILERYVSNVINVSTSENDTEELSVLKNPPVLSVAVSISNQTVIMTLTTIPNFKFTCITFNGKRIKEYDFAVRNGVLEIVFQNI